FTSSATVTSVGTTLAISAGSVNFSSGDEITLEDLTLTSGTLTGSDTVTVNHMFTWGGGTMSGSGVTNANLLEISGGGHTLNARTLNNRGPAALVGPSSSVTMGDGAMVNNQSAGILDIQNDTGFNFSGQGTA